MLVLKCLTCACVNIFFTQFIEHKYLLTCVAHFYEVTIEKTLLLKTTLHDLLSEETFYQKNNTIINNLTNICIFQNPNRFTIPEL